MSLRPFQDRAVNRALTWLAAARPGDKLLFAAPTGSGKSRILTAIQERFPGRAWILTPRVEIVAGLLADRGTVAPAQIAENGLAHRISTPMRFLHALQAGLERPEAILFDEGHHNVCNTVKNILAVCGQCPAIALTATPYRGSPASNREFRSIWGEPEWLIRYSDAAAAGYITMPRCEVLPLVDDDEIEVKNGELVISQIEAATRSKIQHVADYCNRFVRGLVWDRPTLFAAPSRETAILLRDALNGAGHPAEYIDAETPLDQRFNAFLLCVKRRSAVVQVNIIGEGVDLPIRRLVDLAPTLSPVKWAQQIGRIMRPTPEPPEYICTNRNLFRHAYLLDGLVPTNALSDAQDAFPCPYRRLGERAVGLESLGRLRAFPVPWRGGLRGECYSFFQSQDRFIREYCVVIHPNSSEVLWASRRRPSGDFSNAPRWVACNQPPEDLRGYASCPAGELSEKQVRWWRHAAARYGLDETAEVDRRSFQVLPVLAHLNWRRWR